MKSTPLLNNFTAGEVDPQLDARVDVEKYYNSCRILENMIPLLQGGAMRRPGTYYAAEVKDASGRVRLFGFQFSTIQAYILEFGHCYIRFYKDDAQIVSSYSAWVTATAYKPGDLVTNSGNYYRCLVAHTSGTFATDLSNGIWETTSGATDLAYEIPTPYIESDLFELKVVQSADVMFIVHPEYPPMELSRTGHTAWTLDEIAFTYGDERVITAITAANPVVVTSANHGFEVDQWVKFGGINGMTQLNGQYGKITAVTTDTFTIGAINSSGYTAYTSGGIAYPYEFEGTEIDIEGATAANPVVITCTNHGIPDGTIILITDVLGMTQLNNKVYIVAVDDDNHFHLHDYAGSNVNGSGYTAYTSGGVIHPTVFSVMGDYPGAISLFEQRMELSGSENEPQTIYGSASGDFRMFDLTIVADDSAFKYELATEKVDRIHWMMGQDYLLLGTPGGASRFGASSTTDPLTQTNVNAKKQTTFGSKNCDAELVGDAVLYVTRGGKSLREIYFTWNSADANGGYKTTDLTILAKHIAKGATKELSGIVDSDQQQDPISIYWGVRADGQLLGMVYERDQKVVGWFRVVTGKRSSVPNIDTVEDVTETETADGSTVTITLNRSVNAAADEDVWDEVESVGVITQDDSEDEVWIVVKREIEGVTKRYIEYFKPHDFYHVLADYFGVDSGLSFDGGAALPISGITAANPPVVTCTGHTFQNGDKVRIYGVSGMTQVNQGLTDAYTVANAAANTFELSGMDGSAWTTYTSGGYVQKVKKILKNLDHLEGRYIDIMVDGARHPQLLVTSGSVTLSWYGNKIHAGLPFNPIIMPMKLEAGQNEGTAQGKKKRVYGLTVRFYETCTVKWGYDKDHLNDVPFGTGGVNQLFTGDKDYPFDGPMDTNGDIYITQSGPFPMTVLAIMPRIETENT